MKDKTKDIAVKGEEFKYISCYSLSVVLNKDNQYYGHSNTSHVILYPTHLRPS